MKRKIMEKDRSSDWRSPKASTPAAALLNPDILEEIFLNLPPNLVVHLCRTVCHRWKEVADRESFWREKCRREGYSLSKAYKTLRTGGCFTSCSRRREILLKIQEEKTKVVGAGEYFLSGVNVYREGFDNWIISLNGGDGWKIDPLMERHPDVTIQTNFVTSFFMCEKYQIIDLDKEGYNGFFMDNFQPDIRISEWFASRFDCGCKYNIRVELLSERMELIQVFGPITIYVSASAYRDWNQMTHIFQNYGPGVRYVRLVHGGIDTRFWKGWYGVRITDSCVEICPAMHSIVGTGFGRTAKDKSRNTRSQTCIIS